MLIYFQCKMVLYLEQKKYINGRTRHCLLQTVPKFPLCPDMSSFLQNSWYAPWLCLVERIRNIVTVSSEKLLSPAYLGLTSTIAILYEKKHNFTRGYLRDSVHVHPVVPLTLCICTQSELHMHYLKWTLPFLGNSVPLSSPTLPVTH